MCPSGFEPFIKEEHLRDNEDLHVGDDARGENREFQNSFSAEQKNQENSQTHQHENEQVYWVPCNLIATPQGNKLRLY